MPETSII